LIHFSRDTIDCRVAFQGDVALARGTLIHEFVAAKFGI